MDASEEELLMRSVALQNAKAILAEAQRLDAELRQDRELLRITLASIGDGVISTDAQGNVVFLNGVAEKLTGWPMAEAVGKPLTEVFKIVNETTRKQVENPAMRALTEGRIVELANHTVLIARGGAERAIADSAAPMKDASGKVLGVVLVFRDVTDFRGADAAQSRLAAIVQSSDDAIVSKTLDGIIRTWNAAATRLFGWLPEEVIGKSIMILIPPDRVAEEADIIGRIRRGERLEHFETVRRRKDGSDVQISLTVSPIKDHSGTVTGASKIARDITEQKRLQAELQDRAKQLADSDRKKDDFIALLAHELRNPLAPVRTGLQVMRLAANDPAAVAKAWATMDRQLGHMVRLIDDLLDVSRMSRNKLNLKRSRVMLADAVSHAVEASRPLIAAAGHQLTVTLPEQPVPLDADLTRLAQVFGNLLTNSAKYTPQHGHIWLTAEVRGREVFVEVRDSGIGIPPESISGLFAMFAQVDHTTERTSGGLGIGLALVKGLVEAHGGSVSAHSAGAGKGSTFTVRLPIAEGMPAQKSSTPVPGQSRARKIIVADDNRDAAESLAELLGLMGHTVSIAQDGHAAVERAEAEKPDVILMDIGMPGLSGLDATRKIREQPWGKAVQIIALTGWGQEADRARSKEAGCDGHLVKPISMPALEKMLADLPQ